MNRTISPGKISFDLEEKSSCDILVINVENYCMLKKWMFPFPVFARRDADIFVVSIKVKEPCHSGFPQHGDNEEYALHVSLDKAMITSQTVWGAVRGMESLSQLIFYDRKKSKYFIRTVEVHDFPRFSVRGIMIDSSRHYLSKKVIKRQLDVMAMNKMNVLHWHLVDSESFPYVSTTFPQLSQVGAYSSRHVYTSKAIRDILQYARIRGIRVIPEFDLPGHTGSWKGQPELLTECFDASKKPTYRNLVDPSKEENFEFLTKFFSEVVNAFPDDFLHLGGDEVADYITECWKIQDFMKKKSFGNNTTLLENYFFDRLAEIISNLPSKRRMVFWQEVFDNNKPNGSIIQIWKGNTHEEILREVKAVTTKGFNVIVSACCNFSITFKVKCCIALT
ncbi:unnamed protein product [Angiostrongylus costaricensis]|uniref:beta-N-acetylhexosaminidase n=1 Tax=Angiostrongylus costaricensis TaxID=334426 RepID=A0A0R3PHB6_ANGCS|nr:unnamed protein product [Angiostrongylus costaricensis]